MGELTVAAVDEYIGALYGEADEVHAEMERVAAERRFPIVGPLVGRHLEQLARTIGARRVFELGSGFGYSASFFASAVGAGGEVHCTELDQGNIGQAEGYLRRLGLWDRVTYHREEATAALARVGGVWDVVYNDIDKDGYPATVELAWKHLRPGGLFITDNLLWHGRVLPGGDDRSAETAGVREFTRRLFAHPGFLTSILPVRDGVAIALKLA